MRHLFLTHMRYFILNIICVEFLCDNCRALSTRRNASILFPRSKIPTGRKYQKYSTLNLKTIAL